MTEWVSAKLTASHDVSKFDCGNEVLNLWLREQAWRAQERDTARTYVWVNQGSALVKAYYSITPSEVRREHLTSSQAGGISVSPAYLLARLALDSTLHGQGLGGELLFDAIQVIVDASSAGAGRLIVVDAIDDAAAQFYQHYGFQPVRDNPLGLVMKVTTARKALDQINLQVSTDRANRLISVFVDLPDGQSVPLVVSATEMRSIADEIEGLGDEHTADDFRAALCRGLGRDPFSY